MNWIIVGAVAAVAAALAGWLPVHLARRKDRDTLTRTAQIVEKLPGLVAKVDAASDRLTKLEVRLDERDRRESRDEKAASDAAELKHRTYCEVTCPVRQDWNAENITGVGRVKSLVPQEGT